MTDRQLELFPIPNPCRGICQTDQRGYCLGCLRNRDERFRWMSLSDAEKRQVLRLCYQRALRMQRNQAAEPPPPSQPGLF